MQEWEIESDNLAKEAQKVEELRRVFEQEAKGGKTTSGFGQERFNRRELLLLRAYQVHNFFADKWLRFRYRDRVSFGENCSIHANTFALRGTGVVELGNNVIMERGLHKVFFNLEPGSKVVIGDNAWFQTYDAHAIFSCKAGAQISMGKDCWFAGGIFSAAKRITLGDHVLIGYGCLILDSDLHQIDNDTEVRTAPVTIGSHVWMPGYTTILKGVTIGDHCAIQGGSLIMNDIPDHSLVAGRPAKVIRKIGDRDRCP